MDQTDIVKFCYRKGFFGWLVVQTALNLPQFLWAGVSWFAATDVSLYWAILSSGWFFIIAVQYIVATFWLYYHNVTPNQCNNNRRSMPDLCMWMLVHYMVIIYTHEYITGYRPRLFSHAIRLAYLIGVPAILVWSHNTTVPFALAGAGFGASSGLLFSVLLCALWEPSISATNEALQDAKHRLVHVLFGERRIVIE